MKSWPRCPVQFPIVRSERPRDAPSLSPRAAQSPDPVSRGSCASPADGARTGSSSDPPNTVTVAVSGAGQTIGQYVVDSAIRIRCPAGKTEPASLSWMRTPIALPGHQGRRRLVSVPMRKVQHAVADSQRRSVRMHIAQSHGQVGKRPVNRNVKRHDRRAENLDARVEGCGLEHQRPCVILLLVARPGRRHGQTGTSCRRRCRPFAASKPHAASAAPRQSAGRHR